MPLSHKNVLWSRAVGSCFSELKIKDAAIPMANENETLILVQKCLGKKWFLADKRKLEMEQGDCGPISFTTYTHRSCISPTDLLWINLLKFKTLSSIHHCFFLFSTAGPLSSKENMLTCPPADEPSETSVCQFLFSPPLFWYSPPDLRLFFFLIIFPFMLCGIQAGLQNKNVHSSHRKKLCGINFGDRLLTSHLLCTLEVTG